MWCEAGKFISLILYFFINEMGRIRFSVSWGLVCGCPVQRARPTFHNPKVVQMLRLMMSRMHQKGIKIFIAAWDFLGEERESIQFGLNVVCTMLRDEAGVTVSTHGRVWISPLGGNVLALISLSKCRAKRNGNSGGLKASAGKHQRVWPLHCHEKWAA